MRGSTPLCLDRRITTAFGPAVPILRRFDVAVTKRFYRSIWAARWTGRAARAIAPGSAVLIETRGVQALHAELREKGFPFLNPGLEPGPGG